MSDGREVLRGAEIGVHGALAVRRHQDVGAAGGGAIRCRLGLEGDAGGADVVGVEGADLVGLDLADEGGAGAEAGDADDGVGRPSRRSSRSPGPCPGRSRWRGPRRSAPCRPWSCRGGRESPHRSAPARRKSHCRSRERRILRQSFIRPVYGVVRRSRARPRRLRPTRSAPRQQGKRRARVPHAPVVNGDREASPLPDEGLAAGRAAAIQQRS